MLCTTLPDAEEVIVDTVTGDIVSTFAVSSYKSIACYRNLHLLASTDSGRAGCIKLQQLGESVPRWELSLLRPHFCRALGCFSPKGQFIVVGSFFFEECAYVLDAFTGNVRFELSDFVHIYDFKFISDEEFVILSCYYTGSASLQLFNVRSEDILSVLPVDFSGDLLSLVTPFDDECLFLATCPEEALIAICSSCKSDLKVIKVKLSERGNTSGKAKR